MVKPRESADHSEYGNYRVVRSLASGAMGQISVVRDENLNREVALKELFESAADREELVQRFFDEAEITARLEHPGIVPVHTCGTDTKGRPYYTMKLVQGKTFQEAIQQCHALPAKSEAKAAAFRDLIRRFASVCQTMGFAHDKGIIHRDLKPANIMLGEHGETLVMDWGLAKPFAEGGDSKVGDIAAEKLHNRPDITEAGKAIGTPYYMSPEQALGDPLLMGPQSDIYSLGVILYQILTGQLPYNGETSLEVIKKILRETPQNPSEAVKGVSKDLEAICLTAMAREPSRRYRTAAKIYQDLLNWLDDLPVSVRKETHRERIWRWIRKNTALATTLLSAMFVLLVMLGVGAVILEHAHSQAADATMLVRMKEQELKSLQKKLKLLDKSPNTSEYEYLQTRINELTDEIDLLKAEPEPPPQSPTPTTDESGKSN